MISQWLILLAIGLIMGGAYGYVTQQSSNMPSLLSLTIGGVGALLGGAIVQIVHPVQFGVWLFYAAGAGLALGLLVGGTLAYQLTDRERRV